MPLVTEKSNKKVTELRTIMLDFTRMDRDLQQFHAAVELVKRQVRNVCSGHLYDRIRLKNWNNLTAWTFILDSLTQSRYRC